MNLYQLCSRFYKLAQQANKKLVLDPKQKNIKFYTKFLYDAIISYSQQFPTAQYAKTVFDKMKEINSSPAYADLSLKNNIVMIQGALEESSAKLKSAGIAPAEALKKAGMQNVNPSIVDILLKNIETVLESKDFSQYRHYTLPKAGELQSQTYFELDDSDKGQNNPGY